MEQLMQTLGTAGAIAAVVLLFSLAIFIHEFGHYLAARMLGMKVTAFSIGFGPAIWKKKIGGIEYKVSWFLFGGYVALPQLDPAGMENIQGGNGDGKKDGGKGKDGEDKEEDAAEPVPDAPAWKRIIVAAAGPFGNIVLAVAIACILPFTGAEFGANDATVHGVVLGSPADKAGIWPGDRIVSIGGREIKYFSDIVTETAIAGAAPMRFEVERGAVPRVGIGTNSFAVVSEAAGGASSTQEVAVASVAMLPAPGDAGNGDALPPRTADNSIKADFGASGGVSKALYGSGGCDMVEIEDNPFPMPVWDGRTFYLDNSSPGAGVQRLSFEVVPAENPLGGYVVGVLSAEKKSPVWMAVDGPLDQLALDCQSMGRVLGALVTPKTAGNTAKAVSGPVGIGRVLYKTVRSDFWGAIGFLRFLCMNLALINLLPIPVLDGGHIVFALFEMATRRKPNRKLVEWTTTAFAFLVIGLMLLLVFTDSKRWIDSGAAESAEAPVGRIVPADAVAK